MEGLFKALRIEVYFLICDRLVFQHLCSKRLHANKPLLGQIRLHDNTGSFRVSDLVHMLFNVIDNTVLFKIGNQCLAAGKTIHSFIFVCHFIHRSIRMHTDRHCQMVFLCQSKVIRIMCRCTFHNRRTKGHVDIIIRHDRQLFPIGRIDDMHSDDILVTRILRMYKDRLIRKHGFRTSRRNYELFSGFHYLVFEIIHRTFNFLMYNLNIGKRCFGLRVPVDNTFSLIDQTILI